MAPIQIKVCGSWWQIMHKHTQHCCCQASLTDQLKKWRVQKEKPWLTWHNIPIFLYIWDVAWNRALIGTQNRQCTIRGGVNLIPEPWGNFPGQGRSISNFWGNKWQKSPKFLGRFEPWKVGAQTLLWGGRAGQKKQAVHVHWMHYPVPSLASLCMGIKVPTLWTTVLKITTS